MDLCRDLVLAAIKRCEVADQLRRKAQADPASSSKERQQELDLFESCQREFGWQWRNVKRLLEEKE